MICHKPMYYFETAKCMPTKDDGPLVLLFSISLQLWVDVTTLSILDNVEYYKERYSHWMQMPKAPSPTDAHAFLE